MSTVACSLLAAPLAAEAQQGSCPDAGQWGHRQWHQRI